MSDRDRADIHKALVSKGFIEITGTNHDLFILEVEGKKTQVSTFTSRGSKYKSYGTNLLGAMKQQLKLTSSELLQLIDCPLTYDRYIELLKERSIL